jgi:Tfp pilus assembly protein PilX
MALFSFTTLRLGSPCGYSLMTPLALLILLYFLGMMGLRQYLLQRPGPSSVLTFTSSLAPDSAEREFSLPELNWSFF